MSTDRHDEVLHGLVVAGASVASVLDGAGTARGSSPRPFLHPVRTLSGTTVSAAHPQDHDWHCGVGVGIPDLDGVNCWGGPTSVRGEGYVERDDHGSAVVTESTALPGALQQQITWHGTDGSILLHEDRALGWRGIDEGWELTWSSAFRAPGGAVVELGSPGSNGRPGSGYGGLFWRFPPCDDVRVRTPDASGEAGVHGSVAPWIEWSASFAGHRATIRLTALDHDDPWFVRVAEYPAIGSAIAWQTPARVRPGVPLVRSFRATIRD